MSEEGPQRVAHFRIVRKLGQGGMGTVYEAQDEQLGRFVALKLLLSDRTVDEGDRRRFLQEARSAAAVTHANVATLYEAGAADDGTLYLAMELVRGPTLRALLQEGPLPIASVLSWARELARALRKASEAGLVHCDLKPDNVIIDEEGHARLLDFGIARLLHGGTLKPRVLDKEAPLSMTTATQTVGGFAGTPAYMSPEQWAGASVTVRTDLWSFGVLLYELLTARRPFEGATLQVLLSEVSTGAYLPLETLRAGVPPHLLSVVQQCLQVDRDNRPASWSVVLELLGDNSLALSPASQGRELENAATVTSRNPSLLQRKASEQRWGSAARFVLVLFTALSALIALGLGVQWMRATPPPSRTNRAQLRPREAMVLPCANRSLCAAAARGWCTEREELVACCGVGLVPAEGTEGVCRCAPGGTAHREVARCEAPVASYAEQLRQHFRSILQEVTQCYERAMQGGATMRGRVALQLSLGPEGDVVRATIRDSSLPSPEAQRCLLSIVRRTRFAPPPEGSMTVTFPWEFAP